MCSLKNREYERISNSRTYKSECCIHLCMGMSVLNKYALLITAASATLKKVENNQHQKA